MTIPTHIWDAYWSEAKPGTEAALERVIAASKQTPTAFRWTPEMQAIWPREMRPTMTGLLAMWDALQGAAKYAELGSQAASDAPRTCWNGRPLSEAPTSDDGWIEWYGGERPPVKLNVMVDYKMKDGDVGYNEPAGVLRWKHEDDDVTDITHWRPAK